MSENGMMILFIFALIIIIPLVVVSIILVINKNIRKKKKAAYTGITQGTIRKIALKGMDHPWVIYVRYSVNGINYEIKETAKLKASAIKIGEIPIGQRKTFVLGQIKEGDFVEIRYDEKDPGKAIIYKNDGSLTG